MDGKCLATVNEFPHLRHIITNYLSFQIYFSFSFKLI